ncbi:MAG: alpha-L-fucosidase [Bacteroidales bacterium]
MKKSLRMFNLKVLILFFAILFAAVFGCKQGGVEDNPESTKRSYSAYWNSLDKHPTPEWYDNAKFGLFLHWGPYSAEGCGAHEFMKPALLTADKFDPREWIDLAETAGMRYITLTTKHGGGYCMFDTPHGRWNSVDSGPNRDLFGEFAKACHERGMRFLAYYCKDDIFRPSSIIDRMHIEDSSLFRKVVENYKMQWVIDNWPQWLRDNLRTIVRKYEPDGFWFDGTNLNYQYTGIAEVISWIYNNYPDMALNDRVGSFTQRKVHGDFYTYERGWIRPVHILPHKWDRSTPMLGGGWSYDPDLTIEDLGEPHEILWDLVENVSLGGNYHMGIGPRADGSIPEYYQKRLRQIGRWFDVNGECIHNTRPWTWGYFREGENVRYTMSRDEKTVYAIFRNWPGSTLNLEYLHSSVAVVKEVRMLGVDKALDFGRTSQGGCAIEMPSPRPDIPHDIYVVRCSVTRDQKRN